jgi:hypothetical protein
VSFVETPIKASDASAESTLGASMRAMRARTSIDLFKVVSKTSFLGVFNLACGWKI